MPVVHAFCPSCNKTMSELMIGGPSGLKEAEKRARARVCQHMSAKHPRDSALTPPLAGRSCTGRWKCGSTGRSTRRLGARSLRPRARRGPGPARPARSRRASPAGRRRRRRALFTTLRPSPLHTSFRRRRPARRPRLPSATRRHRPGRVSRGRSRTGPRWPGRRRCHRSAGKGGPLTAGSRGGPCRR